MTWLAWRQFRLPALATLAALVVVAIVLVSTGVHLHHSYDTYRTQLAGCQAAGGRCGGLADVFLSHDHHLYQWMGTLLVAVPGVIAMFWGAPLMTRELETGSHRLAWTQSVTRTRWLAVKLAVVGGATLLTVGALSLMVTWWSAPVDHVNMDRFSAEIFSERGLAPIGYAFFGFALGVALGMLIRRTLPAMAATLLGFFVARQAIIHWARPHLLPTKTAALPLARAQDIEFHVGPLNTAQIVVSNPRFPNVLVVSSHLADKAGHAPSSATLQQFLSANCPSMLAPPPPTGRTTSNPAAFQACVNKLATQFHEAVAYIPSNRYWALQGAETAAFLATGLLLIGLCFWWIRHRIN